MWLPAENGLKVRTLWPVVKKISGVRATTSPPPLCQAHAVLPQAQGSSRMAPSHTFKKGCQAPFLQVNSALSCNAWCSQKRAGCISVPAHSLGRVPLRITCPQQSWRWFPRLAAALGHLCQRYAVWLRETQTWLKAELRPWLPQTHLPSHFPASVYSLCLLLAPRPLLCPGQKQPYGGILL